MGGQQRGGRATQRQLKPAAGLLQTARLELQKIRTASGLLFSRSNTLPTSQASHEITYLAQRLGDHAQAALDALDTALAATAQS